MTRKLSSRDHWEQFYDEREDFIAREQSGPIWRAYMELLDRFFRPDPSVAVLEIGCACSAMMVALRRRYGYEVSGLDYSESGCAKTRAVLEHHGFDLGGEILCRDFLEDLSDLEGRFDVVTSFGVVEHFSDPASVLRIFRRLLKPGGMVLTAIPNTSGSVFGLFRLLDPPNFQMHQTIDRERLRGFHADAGLSVDYADYFGMFNPGILTAARPSWMKSAFMLPLRIANKGAWIIADAVGRYPQTRSFSPYIACVARA